MYYTAHLTDYPELRYGYSEDSQRYEFNTVGLIDEYQGKTEHGTWEQLSREYPGIPHNVFTVTAVPELYYGVTYRVPKSLNHERLGAVDNYVTYVLQQDMSLVRIAQSHNAWKTTNLTEAHRKIKELHILQENASVTTITDEF